MKKMYRVNPKATLEDLVGYMTEKGISDFPVSRNCLKKNKFEDVVNQAPLCLKHNIWVEVKPRYRTKRGLKEKEIYRLLAQNGYEIEENMIYCIESQLWDSCLNDWSEESATRAFLLENIVDEV